MSKKELIPEIYVYCDRWCEHCSFTKHCEIFDPTDQEKDWGQADANEFMQEITANFEKTMSLLKSEADANGMNWHQLVADAKEVELKDPILPIDHEEVITLAGAYRRQVTVWLTENVKKIEETTVIHGQNVEMGIKNAQENNIQYIDALEVIQWYQCLIEAKIRRAISGLNNGFEETQDEQSQSHSNGCAKITMLFIQKSIDAWEQISKEMTGQEDKILDHLAALSRLGGKIQKIFPVHAAFIRPGFDTFIL